MWCPACGARSVGDLCPPCAATCVAGPDLLVGAVHVTAPFWHEGAPRRLTHEAKYRGSRTAIRHLARSMAALCEDATALVPVPRTLVRRWRYGVDQAASLATAIGSESGVEVVHALWAPFVAPAHAGSPKADRRPPRFRPRTPVPDGAVLIDDVVTTGTTINAAAASTLGHITTAVSATVARRVTSLRPTESPEEHGRTSSHPQREHRRRIS